MLNKDSNPSISRLARVLRFFSPASSQTAATATVLLMVSAFLSRIIGLVRDKYIAWLFGAGPQTDAYVAAFGLPELINNFLIGGAASVTFVTILSRYRDSGREEDGERALSVILTVMAIVLSLGILAGQLFARQYIEAFNPGFVEWQIQLSAKMTRIVLPAQLFFFSGGVLGAVLLVRKQFAVQAVAPLLYNIGIIAGGLLLASRMGISSLAVGAVFGAFIGPFLLNAIGAYRSGLRYRPALDLSNPGFREWVRLSIPLIFGVSLVFFDDYIVRFFASHGAGEISRLNYAKRLFMAPIAILGQAAGAASLPFFASLWSQGKTFEFSNRVAISITRILSVAVLASSWMIGLSFPLVDLIFRAGRFRASDTRETAMYFSIFAISLALWSAQSLCSRAFYASGDTMTPMVIGTLATLAALPVYWLLYHRLGAVGLALSSDIGITLQTTALAFMLNKRGMVRFNMYKWREFVSSLAAAAASGTVLYLLSSYLHAGTRWQDLGILLAGTLLWLIPAYIALKLTGSTLPAEMFSRFGSRLRKRNGSRPA